MLPGVYGVKACKRCQISLNVPETLGTLFVLEATNRDLTFLSMMLLTQLLFWRKKETVMLPMEK